MANIQNELNNIKNALFGQEVRGSIHDGIDAINKEVESTTSRQVDLESTFDQLVINAGNSNAEIVDARVKSDGTSYSKLGDRLNEVDSQLEQKANIEDVVNISTGTPLFANSTSEMTDTTRNYVNITDGYLYNYSDGQWVKTTILYQATGIADKSIGTKETMYLMAEGEQSKNLFNKDTVIKGKQVNYITGVVDENIETCASDYISVDSGEEYILTHFSSGSDIAFYNSDNVFVSGIGSATNAFIVPLEATKLRLTTRLTNLDTQQLEKGNVRTEYENYYPKTKIYDNSILNNHLVGGITKDKLAFDTVELISSKNLVNKHSVIAGKYINYLNGSLEIASGFNASDYIEVVGGENYHLNISNQFAFYDAGKKFISGLNNVRQFTTPLEAKYIRVTIRDTELEKVQLEKGNKETSFENFGGKIRENIFGDNIIPKSALDTVENIVIVSKCGKGDFLTIKEAIANVNDSEENRIIILVMPGEYVESIKLIGRYITLVGFDRDNTIIKTFDNSYSNPPIDLSVNSNIYNMTIIADENDETVANASLQAYGIHFDIAGRGYDINNEKYQGISRVKNCNIISKNYMAMGIGSSNKQKLIIEDCDLYSVKTSALTLHSYLPSGAIEQKVEFKNCIIHTDADTYVMSVYDANTMPGLNGGNECRDTVFSFTNNILYSEIRGISNIFSDNYCPPIDNTCISGYIKLGKGSYGNNIPEINIKS